MISIEPSDLQLTQTLFWSVEQVPTDTSKTETPDSDAMFSLGNANESFF